MAVKFTNNAKTTLASGINSSVTTATVTDGSVFPTLAAGEHFYCTFDDGTNNEIVKVTARSGNTLTIIRGVDNTTARSFASGDAAELRATSALLTDIQENIAAKSANQTVYNTTTASSATDYDIGIDPSVEANAMVFLNGVMQHHDTFSFSGSTLSFDTAPPDGMALEVIVDNLINLQSSNLTVDTFTAADVGGNPQTDFTLSDAPAAEDNLLVFIDGVFQDQDAYTISNQTLTITDGVTADFGVTVYVINPVNIGTPSDGTVTSSKLSGDITMPADLTVTGDVAFDSPTFVVDNANSRVGIGTASPSTLLDIVGDVKMSANLTVDTSTLHVDATNNRVGIGTASPSVKTHIYDASTDAVLYIDSGNANGSHARFLASGNVKHFVGSGGGFSLGDVDDFGIRSFDNLLFATGNSSTERLRIDASGKTGIGTTSPLRTLHVNSGSTNVVARFESTDSRAVVEFKDPSGAAELGGIGNDIYFAPAGVEKVRIDSSGNVGIGTSADLNANLTVLDTNYTTSSLAGTGLNLRGSSTGNGTYSAALTFTNGYRTGHSAIAGVAENADNDVMGIAFFTHSSTGGTNPTSESMRIDSSGNVGIGTSSPNHDLHIQSTDPALILAQSGSINNANSGRILFAESPSYTTNNAHFEIKYDGLENHLYFGSPIDGSTDLFVVGRDGNVGIGISSPASFGSDKVLVLYDTNTPRIKLQNSTSGSTASDGGEINFSASTLIIENREAGNTAFFNNGSERMRIESNGDVLIGTTSAIRGSEKVGILGGTADCMVLRTHAAGAVIRKQSFVNGFLFLFENDSATAVGSITSNGSTTAYNTSSDARLKDVTGEARGLEVINELNPVSYNWKADGKADEGLIAQEVQEIVPNAVSGSEEKYYQMDYSKLVVHLVKGMKELSAEVEELKQEIREIREGG